MGKLIWIASYPRSGNTWTRLFVNALVTLHAGDRVAPLARADEWSRADPTRYFETWEISAPWYEDVLQKPVTDASFEEFSAARVKVQRLIAERARGPVFVKTHHLNGVCDGRPVIDFSLTDRIIYLVRNPLDVAPSLADHFGMEIDAAVSMMNRPQFVMRANDNAASEVYGSWSENVTSWTAAARPYLHVVRYEDAAADPTQTFMRLGRFLGFRTSAEDVAKAADAVAFEKAQRLEAERVEKHGRQREGTFFRQGRSGGWKEALSEKQVDMIVSAHGETMRRFGYADAAGARARIAPYGETEAGRQLMQYAVQDA